MIEQKTEIIFTGDFCCHSRFAAKLESKGEVISARLKDWLSKADGVVFNYEGSNDGEIPIDKGKANLKNSTLSPFYLQQFCKPVFNLANNHVLDFGIKGLQETMARFQEAGLPYFGAGNTFTDASQPFIIKNEQQTAAVWGIHAYKTGLAGKSTFGLNGLKSLKHIKKTISQSNHFKNIICIHGGEEFTFYPMPYKRKLMHRIAREICPDIIICHHSHTIQGIEKVGKTVIFYSLGNFMFDYPPHKIFDQTDLGLCVKLVIAGNTIDYEVKYVHCDTESQLVDICDPDTVEIVKERLTMENYDEKLKKDAYRVVFGSKKNRGRILAGVHTPKTKVPFAKIRLLFTILSDNFLRSLYWKAFLFKVLNIFQRQ